MCFARYFLFNAKAHTIFRICKRLYKLVGAAFSRKNTEREYRSVLAVRIAFCGDGSLDAVEVIDELIVEVGERIGSDVDVVAIAVQRDLD